MPPRRGKPASAEVPDTSFAVSSIPIMRGDSIREMAALTSPMKHRESDDLAALALLSGRSPSARGGFVTTPIASRTPTSTDSSMAKSIPQSGNRSYIAVSPGQAPVRTLATTAATPTSTPSSSRQSPRWKSLQSLVASPGKTGQSTQASTAVGGEGAFAVPASPANAMLRHLSPSLIRSKRKTPTSDLSPHPSTPSHPPSSFAFSPGSRLTGSARQRLPFDTMTAVSSSSFSTNTSNMGTASEGECDVDGDNSGKEEKKGTPMRDPFLNSAMSSSIEADADRDVFSFGAAVIRTQALATQLRGCDGNQDNNTAANSTTAQQATTPRSSARHQLSTSSRFGAISPSPLSSSATGRASPAPFTSSPSHNLSHPLPAPTPLPAPNASAAMPPHAATAAMVTKVEATEIAKRVTSHIAPVSAAQVAAATFVQEHVPSEELQQAVIRLPPPPILGASVSSTPSSSSSSSHPTTPISKPPSLVSTPSSSTSSTSSVSSHPTASSDGITLDPSTQQLIQKATSTAIPSLTNRVSAAAQRDYFTANRSSSGGSSGCKVTDIDLASHSTHLAACAAEVETVAKSAAVASLRSTHVLKYPVWFASLAAGNNVLVHGVGSKKSLLQDFANEYLTDGPVILLNGFRSSLNLRAFLQFIERDVLVPSSRHRAYHAIHKLSRASAASAATPVTTISVSQATKDDAAVVEGVGVKPEEKHAEASPSPASSPSPSPFLATDTAPLASSPATSMATSSTPVTDSYIKELLQYATEAQQKESVTLPLSTETKTKGEEEERSSLSSSSPKKRHRIDPSLSSTMASLPANQRPAVTFAVTPAVTATPAAITLASAGSSTALDQGCARRISRIAELLQKGQTDLSLPPRIYVVAHSIDGPALRSAFAVAVLGALASLPHVRMIASADNVLGSLLWGEAALKQFNWCSYHATTYETYAEETMATPRLLNATKVENTVSNLEHILASLTANHKSLLSILAQLLLKANQSSSSSSSSTSKNRTPSAHIAESTWVQAAFDDMVVGSEETFRTKAKELMEQGLVKLMSVRGVTESCYVIPYPEETIKNYLVIEGDV